MTRGFRAPWEKKAGRSWESQPPRNHEIFPGFFLSNFPNLAAPCAPWCGLRAAAPETLARSWTSPWLLSLFFSEVATLRPCHPGLDKLRGYSLLPSRVQRLLAHCCLLACSPLVQSVPLKYALERWCCEDGRLLTFGTGWFGRLGNGVWVLGALGLDRRLEKLAGLQVTRARRYVPSCWILAAKPHLASGWMFIHSGHEERICSDTRQGPRCNHLPHSALVECEPALNKSAWAIACL